MALIIGNAASNNLPGTISSDQIYGLDRNDTLSGNNGNDAIYGDRKPPTFPVLPLVIAGNDSLIGGNGNDTIYGDPGNDTLRGGNHNDYLDGGIGNDYLEGGNGSDRLHGGAGSDTLIGVDTAVLNPGRGEIDILQGEAGRDRYILGDGVGLAGRVYYNDGLLGPGNGDYARIIGFSLAQDTIQLAGTAANYQLLAVGGALNQGAAAADTGIYRQVAGGLELIGVVQDVAPGALNLNAAYFNYVI